MIDPVTIGSLVVATLSMAAEAVLKGAVGEAVKDGYKALKERISRWADSEVAALEAMPKSIDRQSVIAKIIDAQAEDDRQSLRMLAEALIFKLKECAPFIGVDMDRLIAIEGHLGNITFRGDIGTRIMNIYNRAPNYGVQGTIHGPVNLHTPSSKRTE